MKSDRLGEGAGSDQTLNKYHMHTYRFRSLWSSAPNRFERESPLLQEARITMYSFE